MKPSEVEYSQRKFTKQHILHPVAPSRPTKLLSSMAETADKSQTLAEVPISLPFFPLLIFQFFL